jgi:hypothetical protein
MVALSGLCTVVRSLFGGPDFALSPEPDCTPDALAMHRHSLRPVLFPLVEPDSDYFFMIVTLILMVVLWLVVVVLIDYNLFKMSQ